MALGAVISGGVQVGVAAAEFEMGKKEAERVRSWQKMMSDTQVRRRVHDMRAAGINPLLAVNAGGGAGGFSGAQASGPNMGGVGSAMAGGGGLELNARIARGQRANLDMDTKLKYAQKEQMHMLNQVHGWNARGIAKQNKILDQDLLEARIRVKARQYELHGQRIEGEIDRLGIGAPARVMQRYNPLHPARGPGPRPMKLRR